jgi:hypothetical protein
MFFWFSVQLMFEKFFILRTITWDTVTNVYTVGLHKKYPLFLSNTNKTWIFSTFFSKKAQISYFFQILLVEAELLQTDGQTDTTKLTVAFHNFFFSKAPRIRHICSNHDTQFYYPSSVKMCLILHRFTCSQQTLSLAVIMKSKQPDMLTWSIS